MNLADHLSDDAERQLAALAVFSPDGLFVASGDWYRAGAIRIWNAATGEEIQSMPVGTWSNTLEFSPDSKWLLSGTGDDTIRVWEVETGREIARMTSKETVTAAGFDPQGQFVVSADDTGAVRTWRWNYTDLIEIACNRLQGNLTRNEWVSYFGEEAYRKTCPNLP